MTGGPKARDPHSFIFSASTHTACDCNLESHGGAGRPLKRIQVDSLACGELEVAITAEERVEGGPESRDTLGVTGTAGPVGGQDGDRGAVTGSREENVCIGSHGFP